MALAAVGAARLAAIPGVRVLTPTQAMATIVTFQIDGWPAEAALDELGSRVFAIARTIASLDAVRISTGFFTSEDELERFAEAVALLASHLPGTLPRRRLLAVLGEA
jgi:selenocysteine lyase/cysteine desulfurase